MLRFWARMKKNNNQEIQDEEVQNMFGNHPEEGEVWKNGQELQGVKVIGEWKL
jgi:hypothetical protein